MTPDELRQKIELEVVELIKTKLTDGTMTEERSQELSRHVLELLTPGMSLEELYKAVPKLDDAFPELSAIVLPIAQEYETNITKQAMGSVQELIRQGKFDAAEKLARNVVDQEVKLTWVGSGKPKSST